MAAAFDVQITPIRQCRGDSGYLKKLKTMEINIDEMLKSNANITFAISSKDLKEFAQLVAAETLSKVQNEVEAERNEEYLTAQKVCKILGVDISTLWRWSKRNYLMPCKVGGLNRYKKSDIEKIFNERGGDK